MNLGKTFSFARGKRSSSSYPDGTEGETSPDTGPASPRSSFSDMMASSRSSISGMMASRKSITDSALSFLAGDPDKAHDKKLSGLQIDASVTTAKGKPTMVQASIMAKAYLYQVAVRGSGVTDHIILSYN